MRRTFPILSSEISDIIIRDFYSVRFSPRHIFHDYFIVAMSWWHSVTSSLHRTHSSCKQFAMTTLIAQWGLKLYILFNFESRKGRTNQIIVSWNELYRHYWCICGPVSKNTYDIQIDLNNKRMVFPIRINNKLAIVFVIPFRFSFR